MVNMFSNLKIIIFLHLLDLYTNQDSISYKSLFFLFHSLIRLIYFYLVINLLIKIILMFDFYFFSYQMKIIHLMVLLYNLWYRILILFNSKFGHYYLYILTIISSMKTKRMD